MTSIPFWESKRLNEMTPAEWESLCDGCGRCCLHKIEDEETGQRYQTRIACLLLDNLSCRCRDYANRKRRVPDCIQLTADSIVDHDWLPPTCAYLRLHQGQGLPEWHPLLTGSRQSVHEAGISVRGLTISEEHIHPDEWQELVIEWPD